MKNKIVQTRYVGWMIRNMQEQFLTVLQVYMWHIEAVYIFTKKVTNMRGTVVLTKFVTTRSLRMCMCKHLGWRHYVFIDLNMAAPNFQQFIYGLITIKGKSDPPRYSLNSYKQIYCAIICNHWYDHRGIHISFSVFVQ